MKVEKLFIISKKELLTSLLENYFKIKELDVFTISDACEALHFVKDLVPSVVLITSEDYSDEEIKNLIDTQIPVLELLDAKDENKKHSLVLPINPINLISDIEKIYNS